MVNVYRKMKQTRCVAQLFQRAHAAQLQGMWFVDSLQLLTILVSGPRPLSLLVALGQWLSKAVV